MEAQGEVMSKVKVKGGDVISDEVKVQGESSGAGGQQHQQQPQRQQHPRQPSLQQHQQDHWGPLSDCDHRSQAQQQQQDQVGLLSACDDRTERYGDSSSRVRRARFALEVTTLATNNNQYKTGWTGWRR